MLGALEHFRQVCAFEKPKRELENHKRFEDLLLKMDPKYLHWMVSDGTQKLTLISRRLRKLLERSVSICM